MSTATEKPRATREAIGEGLVELGGRMPEVVVLDADLAVSTQTAQFRKAYPDRFFDFGIAEANMMCAAAGLAASGKMPFVSTFAIFATSRVFDQVRQSIAATNVNVRICASHGGITVGPDGASHQSIEDVALMRILPNMRVIVPADFNEAMAAIRYSAEVSGPCYIRLGRSPVPNVTDADRPFQGGSSQVMREGLDITIIANGIEVGEALAAAQELSAEGIEAEVINASSVKPLDSETILQSAAKTGIVLTAEEHSIIGGLGSAVAELLSEEAPVPMKRVGVRDAFGCSGDPQSLLELYGLTGRDIAEAARSLLDEWPELDVGEIERA